MEATDAPKNLLCMIQDLFATIRSVSSIALSPKLPSTTGKALIEMILILIK